MAGLRRRQCRRHGLGVPHLPDQYDVGVLAHGGPHGNHVAVGVDADLALVNGGTPVGVEDFDRVLDREDVDGPFVVDVIDHRGESGRLARAGRPRHKDESPRSVGEGADDLGDAELFERRAARAYQPHDDADRPPLAKDVHSEPSHARDGVGEVRLLLPLHLLAAVGRHDRAGDDLGVLGREGLALQPPQLAVHADGRREPHGKVEVRATVLHHRSQQRREIRHLSP